MKRIPEMLGTAKQPVPAQTADLSISGVRFMSSPCTWLTWHQLYFKIFFIPVVCGLRVAREGVEEAGGEHAEHVGEELDDDGDDGQRRGGGRRRLRVSLVVEQDLAEVGGEEGEAEEVRPDVDRLVVHPEPAMEKY